MRRRPGVLRSAGGRLILVALAHKTPLRWVQLELPLRFRLVVYEVAVVEGTKKHRSQEPAQGISFYRSALFRLAVERARREQDDLIILSALYGLVEQLEVIEPYEISIRDLRPQELRAWADRVTDALCDLYAHERLVLVAYASQRAVKALRPVVRARRPGWSVRTARGWKSRGDHGGRPTAAETAELRAAGWKQAEATA